MLEKPARLRTEQGSEACFRPRLGFAGATVREREGNGAGEEALGGMVPSRVATESCPPRRPA